MVDQIVVISRDDTFMHVGPPDRVRDHLFSADGDIPVLPSQLSETVAEWFATHLPDRIAARLGPVHRLTGGLSFENLDTFDAAGGALEWTVDRHLRPQRVYPVPEVVADPDRLLERMRAVIAHVNAEVANRADLAEFRDTFYVERLVPPPDLTTAVNAFADLGPPPVQPVQPNAGPGAGDSPVGPGVIMGASASVGPGGVVGPGGIVGPGGSGPTVGTIPHAGSWFHNLMHRIMGP